MLPISHKLAMHHYMPMLRPLLRVISDVKDYKGAISADLDGASSQERSIFFHLMFFWWHFNATQNKEGGIYFKNRVGEKIILNAFLKFRNGYKGEGAARIEVEKRVKRIHQQLNSKFELPDFDAIVVEATDKTLFQPNVALRDAC
jgi:hypothetical protein